MKSHESLDDQISLSSHEALVPQISNLDKEKFDEVMEDLVATFHEDLDAQDSIEDYAFHLDPKEATCDDDEHLQEENPIAIMDSREDKNLLS